jgi:ATP-dependent exoDNAse (exonuclease V) beta subunit
MRGLDHLPALAAVRDETDARQVRESFCLLYVAMTRARDRLDLLVDAPKSNEMTIPATAAGLLRSALAPEATEPGVVWRSGEASGDR